VRILGLDVGDLRIGVALCDPTQTLATGIATVSRVGPRKDVKAIRDLVRDREVERVVVGIPWRPDGSLGPQGEKVMAFALALRRSLPVPVETWDERFTTVVADERLAEAGIRRRDRKARIDRAAAAVMLQGYLDAGSAGAPEGGG
jgi:putative Holliday junction resolvase